MVYVIVIFVICRRIPEVLFISSKSYKMTSSLCFGPRYADTMEMKIKMSTENFEGL